MKDNENLITEDEKLRIAAIDDVKARQDSTEEYRLYRRVQEDKRAAQNYEIFSVQCKINEMLNKLVKFVKNYHEGSNELYRISSGEMFCELVEEEDFNDFANQNIIPSIDTEVVDPNDSKKIEEKKERRSQLSNLFYNNNIEFLRSFLYYCHGLIPVPIPKYEKNGSIDVLQSLAAGINPESFLINNDKWFLEQKDYSTPDLSSIVINGEIHGHKIASRIKHEEEQELVKTKKM